MKPSFVPPKISLAVCNHCRTLLLIVLIFYFICFSYTNKHIIFPGSEFFCTSLKATPSSQSILANATHFSLAKVTDPPTNLSHVVFGLLGSVQAWHHRKEYIESWWRPNVTRGFLFLDAAPGPQLLPWPESSPPYRVSDDLSGLLNKSDIRPQRMVHGIMEVLRELKDEDNVRWVVMGDDDSIFFVDNLVDVLAKYDHTRYYYLGGHSEFLMSNFWFSFNQGFGGAGIILSYPLAKALARDMDNCLKRYAFLNSADNTTRNCIADIGADLSAQKGNHQVDLHGDISGFLSAHPPAPLISLHHFDMVEPIFPSVDRFESTRHLMKAADADQSRMLQQTICHHRQSNWSFSVSWGYSAHIYERIMSRSYLQTPIETFIPWMPAPGPPTYMFNTRKPSSDPCEAPHAFFFKSLDKRPETNEIHTTYSRAWPRTLPACLSSGNHSADHFRRIHVFSPATKRTEVDRCECCDIVRVDNKKAVIKFRQCRAAEVIA